MIGNNLVVAGREQRARRWRRSSPPRLLLPLLAVPVLCALAIAVASAGLLFVDLMSGPRRRRQDGVLRGGNGSALHHELHGSHGGAAAAVWEESGRYFDWTRLSSIKPGDGEASAVPAVVVANRGDVDDGDGANRSRETLGKDLLLRLLASTDYCSVGRPPLRPSSREFTVLRLTLGADTVVEMPAAPSSAGEGEGKGERDGEKTKTSLIGRWIESAFPGTRVRSISVNADEWGHGNLGRSSPICRTLTERRRQVDMVLVEVMEDESGRPAGSGSPRNEEALSSPSLVPGHPAHLLTTATYPMDGVGVGKIKGDTATVSTPTAIERGTLGGKWTVLRAAHPPLGNSHVSDGGAGGVAETRTSLEGVEAVAQVAAVLYVSRVLGEELSSLSMNKGLDHTCQVAWEYVRTRERGDTNDEREHGGMGNKIENEEEPTSFFDGLCT